MQDAAAGMAIRVFYDRSALVDRAIHTVGHNLIEGAIFVVVILLLMPGRVRAGLVVAAVIPASMLMAFAGMRALDIPANLMMFSAARPIAARADGSIP